VNHHGHTSGPHVHAITTASSSITDDTLIPADSIDDIPCGNIDAHPDFQ